ncbi:MAG: hypothetical protein NXI20_17945 [bacterium]|nr:hypothetical protein [bacterium]
MQTDRIIKVEGYSVELVKFDHGQFMYPIFNGDAEFEANKNGYKKMRGYLRTLRHVDTLMDRNMDLDG